MKELLFQNWHMMRWIRLAFALFLMAQTYILKEWMFIGFALFFLIQVLFNLGCGANTCAVPNKKKPNDE